MEASDKLYVTNREIVGVNGLERTMTACAFIKLTLTRNLLARR